MTYIGVEHGVDLLGLGELAEVSVPLQEGLGTVQDLHVAFRPASLTIGSSFSSAKRDPAVFGGRVETPSLGRDKFQTNFGSGAMPQEPVLVSDGAMRARLKSDLGSVAVSHLLSDFGVHSRIPAASFPFSFLPAAPPHGPDAQECVGGVKRVPIDGRSG